MGSGVRRFTDLRAWQACDVYKKAVYKICANGPLEHDWQRRRQLEKSVAGPPAHLSEGFGRFNPADFARYTVLARSSLMESQNHLLDLVDVTYIDEDTREALDALAITALEEVTGLMEYLQTPEALRNARRSRERRIASRSRRRLAARQDQTDEEAKKANAEPGTEAELRTEPEPRTERRTEPRKRTKN
jgi:four helix bundle protein